MNQRPPGQLCKRSLRHASCLWVPRAASPDQMNGAPARVAPSLARWWFSGRSLGVPALLSGSFLATSCRPPATPFVVLEPPVGRSRPRFAWDAAANPSGSSFLLTCGAGSLRSGVCGRVSAR